MITVEEYLKFSKEQSNNDIRIEYNKNLCAKYPWLIPINRWTGKIVQDYDYEYTELDNMPDGWRIAFGDRMCEEIQKELEKFDFVNKYHITQIKEKFGGLRWYDSGTPVGKLSTEYDIIKTDKLYELPKNDDDYYEYIGKDDDENYTMMYRHYKILDKCNIHQIIQKYEDMSYKICINCGAPAMWESESWISPWCNTCVNTLDIYDSFHKITDVVED